MDQKNSFNTSDLNKLQIVVTSKINSAIRRKQKKEFTKYKIASNSVKIILFFQHKFSSQKR